MIERQPTADADDQARLARAAAEAGFEDVLVIERETAKAVLTDKRQELLDRIRSTSSKPASAAARASRARSSTSAVGCRSIAIDTLYSHLNGNACCGRYHMSLRICTTRKTGRA